MNKILTNFETYFYPELRILVISGTGLPSYNAQENIYEVVINAIFSVTGLDMNKRDFHIVHRHGRNSERIFAEYVSHISSKILS